MKQMMTKEKIILKKNGNTTIKFIVPTHHPLLEKVIDDLKPIFSKLSKTEQHDGARVNKYEEGERYIIDSFERLSLLNKREKQFLESLNFLTHRPTEALLKRYKMSHQDFVEYHHDTLLNFYTSYPECAYQCVNQILNLGIPERAVSAAILKNHKWVKEMNLSKYISDFDKLRIKHANDRNQTTHQGRSKDINELSSYFLYDNYADSPFPAEDLKPTLQGHKRIRRKLYEFQAKIFLSPIKSDFSELMSVCETLLNELIPPYEYWTGEGKKYASMPCTHTIKTKNSR